MKKLIASVFFSLFLSFLFAQKYWTQNGQISFFSEAPLENIESVNEQVSSIVDFETGEMVFSLLMKAFLFEKALMQEHFNEKYVHSDKYPKAQFKGVIQNIEQVSLDWPGTYPVRVSGELTIHGQTNTIETEGEFVVSDQKEVEGSAEFYITLSDYDITIPSVVKDNISKEIIIKVLMNYVPYEK